MHGSDPKKYMELVKLLKSGSFDKKKPSDTEAVEPDEWFDHFSSLLGKQIPASYADAEMQRFFNENVDRFSSELDHPSVKSDFYLR